MDTGKYEERLFKACRSILGVADERVLTAIFLIRETRRMLGEEADRIDAHGAQGAMFRQCDRWQLDNPFHDINSFMEIYHLTDGIEKIDWETMLSLDETEHLHIPKSIFDMMEEKVQPETKQILIAEGQRFAPFLKGLIEKYDYCRYVITAEQNIHAILLRDIFRDNPQVAVVQASIYEYEFLREKFDLILSVPTMGRRNRVDALSRFMSRDYEMVALENLLLHLTPSGKLVIVMPAKIAFGGGRIANLRDFVQEMYCLEEILELPGGIFTGTGVKTHLLVISMGKTEEVAIKRYGFEREEGKSGRAPRKMILLDDSFVVSSELVEQGDWNVDKLFARQDEDWQRFMERDGRIRLKEVAQVFRGKNILRKDSTGNVGVVNISNLGEYTIDYENLEHISEPERKLTSYLLEDGDVLLPARGTATRIAVFRQQDYPCITSSNIIVIRPRQDLLDSVYLKMFFDSPLGAKILASVQQGTAVVNLSFRDLQEVEIPLPPMEEQKQMTNEYQRELDVYLKTIQNAEERWNNTLEKLQAML